MKVPSFLLTVLLAGWPVASTIAAAEAPQRHPNIVFIVADDMGYGDVGYLGGKDIRTPHIDSLSKRGIWFSQGYVTASVCGPSRAALLTGVYQQRLGCGQNPPEGGYPKNPKSVTAGLPVSQPTLAEMLKPLGYRSGIIGKWHLGLGEPLRPLARGFDEHYGFLNGAHSYYQSTMEFGKKHNIWPIFRNAEMVKFKGYLTDVFTEEAVGFIERNKGRPFFLYLSYNAVHGPWEVPDSYQERLQEITHPNRRFFAAMTLALDDGVGRVVKKLKQEGLDRTTLLVFVSDNGTPKGQKRGTHPADHMSSSGPLRGYKGDTYEGGIRVPFIIHWPGVLPSGQRYDYPVSTLDLVPTIAAHLGIEKPPKGLPFDGVNLLPYLKGTKTGRPHEIMYWRRGDDYAIRRGDWKLAWNDDGPKRAELFNLAKDLGEKSDVTAENQEIAKELQELFDTWDGKQPDSPWWRAPANRKRN